jgi:hypothetical protein
MIDRRSFMNHLGASALLAAIPAAVSAEPQSNTQATRARLPLHGEWELHIDGTPCGVVTVPASRRPSGYYRMNRSIVLPPLAPTDRVFIHFEAITYWGRVTVNGKPLGTMIPYVPHEFEFTAGARGGANQIEVEIADLVPLPDGTAAPEIALGVNPGWEAYGGIIRDVWVEIRPAAFIENVCLAYDFADGYSVCNGRPRVLISASTSGKVLLELFLKHGEVVVASASRSVELSAGSNEVELGFALNDPSLWSPDLPNLYEMTAFLGTSAGADTWKCNTGFRDIKAQGREFLLNGKRLVLNGVCRHDMWKDEGFTLSPRQQELDMRMIKSMGCNFVRLVHYPHDRRIVELADQFGLLVSEEPGFWQMNFHKLDRARIELGYRILEKTIERDWNSPSVMIWFLANECTLSEEFLREGKRRCNQIDPIERLVSAANDKSAQDVKPLFVASGMDFFDQHEYTFDLEQFDKEAEFDGPDKPLTFSEWGGKSVGQSEPIMRESVDRLIDLVEDGELSGHMFWSWQDLRQYSRIDGEMRDGVLESGAVTEAREPRKLVVAELTRLFARRRSVEAFPEAGVQALKLLPLKWISFSPSSKFHPVDLQSLAETSYCHASWTHFESIMARYWEESSANDQWKRTGSKFALWKESEVKIAGVAFRSPVVQGFVRPIVLTNETPELTIPLNLDCSKLHLLGQVTFPVGYPILGKRGDTVAVYTLQYASGKSQSLPMRHGIEIAQANRVHQATRIDPIATAAQPALEYLKDVVREQYQILLLSIPTERERLVSLNYRLLPQSAPLAIFAITTERHAV